MKLVNTNTDSTFLSNKRLFSVILITVFIVLINLLHKDFGNIFQYFLLIAGTLIWGIPHGANDNSIFFKKIKKLTIKNRLFFYLSYTLTIFAVFLFWYLFPSAFLILFVLYSAYHFGQSNWFYLSFKENNFRKILQYLTWGLYVILVPVLMNFDESIKIISFISSGYTLPFEVLNENKGLIISNLLLVNILFIAANYSFNYLQFNQALKEILILLTLTLLYYTTPLYLSFFTYWIFFHSYNSFIETSQYLYNSRTIRSLFKSWKKSLPLSLVSYLGMILLYLVLSSNSENVLISTLFIVIACLTVPHMIVIQYMYNNLNLSTKRIVK